MQIIADDSFRDALRNLNPAVKDTVVYAIQEIMAAPTISDFAKVGRELINVTPEGFTLPVKENYQNTLASIEGVLTADGKLKLSLKAYY